MRLRIALTTLMGLFAASILAQPAEACGGRRKAGCGGGHGMARGHRGKYVTYNGANYATYPTAGGYAAPSYGPSPQYAPSYAPTGYDGMVPPPPPMGG